MTQYIRTAWMLDVVGIPTMGNENSKDIICKVAELAGVKKFLSEQIYVGHWVSNGEVVLIIVLLTEKSGRDNFYDQKKYCFFLDMIESDRKSRIHVNESLTPDIRKPLKKIRQKAKYKHC